MEKNNLSSTSAKKKKDHGGGTENEDVIGLLSLFFLSRTRLKYLQYLDRLLPCISAKMLLLLHGMNETN